MNYAYISFKKQGIFKIFCWMGIFLFGLFLTAEFGFANSVNCGDTVTSNVNLTANLDCSWVAIGLGPILVVEGPAKLNLNGFTVIGNLFTDDEGNTFGDTCIEVTDASAKVWNGTVVDCADGVVIAGEGRHKIWKITSKGNAGFGFKVLGDSDGNRLIKNQAIGNINDNFRVEEDSDDNRLIKNYAENSSERGYDIRGNNTLLLKNKANGNRDDALRLRFGNNNEVIHNIFNGSESGEGVEIRSEGNIVRQNTFKHNVKGVRIRENDNVVKHNFITNNGREGIIVEGSANLISRNIIMNNGFIKDKEAEAFHDGLKVKSGAEENILTRNLLSKNIGNGINIDEGAIGNNIKKNIAMENGVDVIYFDARDGNLDPQCDNNIWCDNNIGTKNQDCIDNKDCEDI